MWRRFFVLSATIACFLTPQPALAQLAPEIGYVYPAGGRAGTTIDVTLGGYDWTPDMQIFVHDPRIKLEIVGPPSKVLVPPPPYWFGAKARGYAWPLPREFPARLTIPADVPPGPVKFQVANANGASPVGFFHVGSAPELKEEAGRTAPQMIPQLPAIVNGQIKLIEEIDRYEFTAAQAGPITIELIARQMNSPLHCLVKVIDDQGKCVVDLADTEGRDLATTFIARAGAKYILSLHDLDYAGDFSYVYRLAITPGPRVVAAYPAAGQRGTLQKMEFLGLGIATGADKLESLTKDVAIPATPGQASFQYSLETPQGIARPFPVLISDRAEQLEVRGVAETQISPMPAAITGGIEQRFGSDRFVASMKKDEKWQITGQAAEIRSPLDLDLSILGPDGKVLAANDDAPGTTDPKLFFTSPADGDYVVVLSDRSGKSGGREANYRLVIEPPAEDVSLALPAHLSAPIGGQFKLALKATRQPGHKAPIQLSFAGLPAGVFVPAELVIPEDKVDLPIDLTCAADAAATASLVTITATTKIGNQSITRTMPPMLVAIVMKPRIKIMPEGLDDVRKVHRGSTFLAPLHLERLEGYAGEITLAMTAKQQRHRQGLAADEFIAPAGAKRVEYPIFVPEWMETTKTSRMIVNGVVNVADPQGNVRTLVQRQELRIGILPEGAILKISAPATELQAKAGEELRVPITLFRAPEMREQVRIELIPTAAQSGLIAGEPVTPGAGEQETAFTVRFAADPKLLGEQTLHFRAVALQGGKWPVISESSVLVNIAN